MLWILNYIPRVSKCHRHDEGLRTDGVAPPEDLEGLKVSHDFEDLAEGEARILTLKDSRILDNEGTWVNACDRAIELTQVTRIEDELHNIDMAEVEKDKKRHELKTKRRDYTGYDDEEFGAGGDGLKRSVLAKYDEDLQGAPDKVRDSPHKLSTFV